MARLAKINKWISDHKILSGIAGVIIMGILTIAFTGKSGTDESGTINFQDQTEISNSNLSGRDMHITKEIAPDKEFLNRSDSTASQNKSPQVSKEEAKIGNDSAKDPKNKKLKTAIITDSYLAGRDINIIKKDQSALIKLLQIRAKEINENLSKYYNYEEVENYLEDFNQLHKEHIEALENNDFILAHELLRKIHGLSFSLDSKEQEAQQKKLFGYIMTQYSIGRDSTDLFGGIAALYFNKKIKLYDSTQHVGPLVYFNKLERGWDYLPTQNEVQQFYKENFLD